jgi:hypothetical protein
MTILIITSSDDGTADQIIKSFDSQNFFRWNVDLWQSYDLSWTDSLLLSDPTGRCIDLIRDNFVALWRKPNFSKMNFDGLKLSKQDQDFAIQEYSECLKSITLLLLNENRFRLVDPHGESKLPKLYQGFLAKDFFDAPKSFFSTKSIDNDLPAKVVTKAQGYPMTNEGNIFFTTLVNQAELFRPYPWLIQEPIIGGIDITCVHIHGRNHFFVCEFERSSSAIDWRTEINSGAQSNWIKFLHPKTRVWSEQINRFMRYTHLHFGRLDFIYREDTLFFLECNPNGQFGWLDDDDSNLHREFYEALKDPSSAIV